MNFYTTSYTEANTRPLYLKNSNSKNFKKSRRNPIKFDFDILSNFEKKKFNDTAINKSYSRYLQKQAFIQHEQKLYDIIEKSDEPKIFNRMKNNYLKELDELNNIHNIQKDNKKVTDIISSVNLKNAQKRLYSLYKLSSDDLYFMTSFMNHLGNRPQKVYKSKVNQKLEALSKGKLGNYLKKKEEDKKIKDAKKEKYLNNINNLIYEKTEKNDDNNNYYKMLLNKLNNNNNHNINSDNDINNNNDNKINIDKHLVTEYNKKSMDMNKNEENKNDYNIGYKSEYKIKNFRKKNTVNINTQNIKLFRNKGSQNSYLTQFKHQNTIINDYKKFSVSNKSLNFNQNILKDNSKSKSKNSQIDDNNNNINKNIKSKFNSKKSFNSLNNEGSSSIDNKNPFNSNVVTSPIIIKTATNFRDEILNKISIEQKDKNQDNVNIINIDIQDDSSNDESKSKIKSSSKINVNIKDKNKIINSYRASMNEFLEKVKQEGNILNKTSYKLSFLLKKLRAENFETFQNARNAQKKVNFVTQRFNKTMNNLSSKKDLKKKIGRTFYQSHEKSRFRMPDVNKAVYGENNKYDPFEILQKELFNEVKSQMKKVSLINKKSKKKIFILGKDILNKLISNDSDDLMRKELNKINNQNDINIKNNDKGNNKSNIKSNNLNKSSNIKNDK